MAISNGSSFEDKLQSSLGSLRALKFVQIGANDGVRGDPIRDLIIKHAWTGVLVEPLSDVFDSLVRGYASHNGLAFEHAAVCVYNGNTTLYRARGSDASTLKEERLKDKLRANASPIQVPCMTLRALIQKHQIGSLDLLQIDTEGYDWEIIRQLPTLEFWPRVIHFEAHLLGADYTFCTNFLTKNGYVLGAGASKRDILAVLEK